MLTEHYAGTFDHSLRAGWVLIDRRDKPDKDDESYPGDPLGPVMAELRSSGIIKEKGVLHPSKNPESRYNVSPMELDSRELGDAVLQALHLKLTGLIMRLPSLVEWYYFANVFYPSWLKTHMLEWVDDGVSVRPEDLKDFHLMNPGEEPMMRLYTGRKESPKKLHVRVALTSMGWNYKGFRPLIRLSR